MARISHATYRSGVVRCPVKIPWSEKMLKYDPLAHQFECFPSNTEPQWNCDRCKCKRGVHLELDTGLRGACTDPDCPGCPGGCFPP
jgi:hypothetical protein